MIKTDYNPSDCVWFGDFGENGSNKKMPKKSEIVKYWYEFGERAAKMGKWKMLPFFIKRLIADVAEPFCWGCNTQYEGYEETKQSAKLDPFQAYYNHWNKLKLDRAHVIAVSLGGSNELNNLILLCSRCHFDSPDVKESHVLLNWLQRRPHEEEERKIREYKQACAEMGVTPEQTFKLKLGFYKTSEGGQEYEKFSSEYSTIHYDHIPYSTEIACILAYAKQKGIGA